jgi:hypothetical protein
VSIKKKVYELQNNGGSDKEIKTELDVLQKIKNKMDNSSLSIAPLRHFFQLIYFIISIIVLLVFLRKHLFSQNSILAFVTVLLFVTHPVHTEVIANIKSRDEILSFLFIILTLHFSFNYIQNRSQRNLLLMIASFVLALLSKEYAMVLPILIIIGWFTIARKDKKEILNTGLFFLVSIAFLFVYIRFTAFSNSENTSKITEVLNDPYLYATPIERIASKIALVLEYLRVLFFPLNLSCDYSYSHFAYIEFNNWKFISSVFIYIAFGLGFRYAIIKKLKTAFPIAFFLGFLFLVNNLLFNIGATMGERLVYHSSFGLCLLLVFYGDWIYQKIKISNLIKQISVVALVLPVLVLFSFKTIERNKDWKSDTNLFLVDVKTVPNSLLLNTNVGNLLLNRNVKKYSEKKAHTNSETKEFEKQLKIAMIYFDKAISIDNNHSSDYMNRGLCYYYLKDAKRAGSDWVRAAEILNGTNDFLKHNSYFFIQESRRYGLNKQYKEAIESLEIAAIMNPSDVSVFSDLGAFYYRTAQFKLSADAYGRALLLNPNLKNEQYWKQMAEGIYNLEENVATNPNDIAAKQILNNTYRSSGISIEYLNFK